MFLVIASFHQTLWNINPVSSGGVRSRNMGEFLADYPFSHRKIMRSPFLSFRLRLWQWCCSAISWPRWSDNDSGKLEWSSPAQVSHCGTNFWKIKFQFVVYHSSMVIYQGGSAGTQARSLWRIELIRMKWHGALVAWEQVNSLDMNLSMIKFISNVFRSSVLNILQVADT